MRSDPYGVTLGQILTTTRLTYMAILRIERKMAAGKPPRWELHLKDILTILLFMITLYSTGSIREALSLIVAEAVK